MELVAVAVRASWRIEDNYKEKTHLTSDNVSACNFAGTHKLF